MIRFGTVVAILIFAIAAELPPKEVVVEHERPVTYRQKTARLVHGISEALRDFFSSDASAHDIGAQGLRFTRSVASWLHGASRSAEQADSHVPVMEDDNRANAPRDERHWHMRAGEPYSAAHTLMSTAQPRESPSLLTGDGRRAQRTAAASDSGKGSMDVAASRVQHQQRVVKSPPASRSQRRRTMSSTSSDSSSSFNVNAFFTFPSQIIETLPYEVSTVYCNDGFVGVPYDSSSLFRCEWYDTTTHTMANVTKNALQFAAATSSQRSNCTYIEGSNPAGKICLCSNDYAPFCNAGGLCGCLPRQLYCSTSWLGLPSGCMEAPYLAPQRDMNNCARLSRSSTSTYGSVFRGSLLINCEIDPNLQVDWFPSLGPVPVSIPNASFTFVPVTAINTTTQPFDTYYNLSLYADLFPTVVPSANIMSSTNPTRQWNGICPLTSKHPLAQLGTVEMQVFDFNQPSREDGGARRVFPLQQKLNASAPNGSPVAASLLQSNGVAWDVVLDVSTIPEHYVYGGRLYLEAGVTSPFGLANRYSVSRMYIEVDDMQPNGPTRRYPKPLDSGTVALIAVGVAIAIGIILVVLWKLWQSPEKMDVGKPHHRKHAPQEEHGTSTASRAKKLQ